jgi:hypothetical protein
VALLALIEPTSPGASAGELPSAAFSARVLQLLKDFPFINLHRKLIPMLERIHGRVKNSFKTAACTVYHLLRRPLPPSLQTFYIEEIVYGIFYHKAARAYIPHVYPGQVTLFNAQASTSRWDGWSKLVTGGIEVHETSGTHLGIIQEPHVWELAEQLRLCLHKAQVRSGIALDMRDANGQSDSVLRTLRSLHPYSRPQLEGTS